MELSSLLPVAQKLAIKFPDGEPTGVTLLVTGQDTKAFQDTARVFQQKFLAGEKPTAAELEAFNVELTASCVVGWEGLELEGQPLPYSKQQAIDLMGNPGLKYWREQVEAFCAARKNFFRRGE